MKVNCKNCGDPIEIPEPPRPRITLFNLEGLFSEYGVLIVLAICCVGIPSIFIGGKDSEYEAIRKALETPDIKVEVTKNEKGNVGWKIVKEK